MSIIICEFQPETIRLIDLVETNLHWIVRQEMSRQQAMDIKSRFATPLGILSKRHELQMYRSRAKELIDFEVQRF